MSTTPEELADATRKVRDRDFAHLAAFVLTLAAQTAPDVIRRALADVFDMREWAEQEASLEVKLQGLEMLIDDAREEVRSFVTERNTLRKQVAWQQCQIDDLKEEIEGLKVTRTKIQGWAKEVQRRLPAAPANNGVAAQTQRKVT